MPTPVLPTRLIANTATALTLTAYAQNAVVTSSNAAGQSLTLPASTLVNFPLGSQITIVQLGAGVVTAVAPSDGTLTGTVTTTVAGTALLLTKVTGVNWVSQRLV